MFLYTYFLMVICLGPILIALLAAIFRLWRADDGGQVVMRRRFSRRGRFLIGGLGALATGFGAYRVAVAHGGIDACLLFAAGVGSLTLAMWVSRRKRFLIGGLGAFLIWLGGVLWGSAQACIDAGVFSVGSCYGHGPLPALVGILLAAGVGSLTLAMWDN